MMVVVVALMIVGIVFFGGAWLLGRRSSVGSSPEQPGESPTAIPALGRRATP